MTVVLAYLFSFITFLLFPTIVLCLNTGIKYRVDRPTSVCQPVQTDVKVFQTSSISLAQATWKHAIEKAKAMPDPWAEFHLEEIETERCTRYR